MGSENPQKYGCAVLLVGSEKTPSMAPAGGCGSRLRGVVGVDAGGL